MEFAECLQNALLLMTFYIFVERGRDSLFFRAMMASATSGFDKTVIQGEIRRHV